MVVIQRERERDRERERERENESKRRGFLEGTLMEHNMNFFFFSFLSVLASGLVQRAGLGEKKKWFCKGSKKEKMEKKFDIFVEL